MFSASDYDSLNPEGIVRNIERHSFLLHRSMNHLLRPAISHDAQLVTDLAAELRTAVRLGHASSAVDLARRLAELRPVISAELETDSGAAESEMNLTVYICNKNSPVENECVSMKFQPSMTIETLKSMAFQRYGYLSELQRWIVGRRMANDQDKLMDLGIDFDGAVAFLYLLTPHDSIDIKAQKMLPSVNEIYANVVSMANVVSLAQPPPNVNLLRDITDQSHSSHLVPENEEVTWKCFMCTFDNAAADIICEMCREPRPVPAVSTLYGQTNHETGATSNSQEQHLDDYDFVDGFS